MNELTQHTEQGEIILYQPNETVRLEVRLEEDTVWLNRQQLAELFGRDIKTIGKHINNALKEELRKVPTVAKFAIVQMEGNRKVTRTIEFYNLDMVISVGYRVKSDKGIEFRITDAGLRSRSITTVSTTASLSSMTVSIISGPRSRISANDSLLSNLWESTRTSY